MLQRSNQLRQRARAVPGGQHARGLAARPLCKCQDGGYLTGTSARRVLATSPDDGLIECVPSMALANVIAEHRSIARYLALHNPDPEGARRCPAPHARCLCMQQRPADCICAML